MPEQSPLALTAHRPLTAVLDQREAVDIHCFDVLPVGIDKPNLVAALGKDAAEGRTKGSGTDKTDLQGALPYPRRTGRVVAAPGYWP